MCEHRIIWRHCPSCRKRASPPLLHNVNCEKTTIWKLGRCSLGLRNRDIVEQVECEECCDRRVAETEEERRRLWEKAWPGPVQPLESHALPETKDKAQQTEEEWPKVEKEVEEKEEETVEQQAQVEGMYDADDEDDDEGLFIPRTKSKKKSKTG
ncbi:hypothetical protein FLONG3_5816 [Fusarium longipes]|uniref:Uncharacterized protein n=1 Tax=Fusarium longipes TaxID=694270 RepID=A0A395SSV0_9HYPO|nr:hypothetical protein FLONG3_5816 [Fusarium longipes]